jgi:hypothetical protein
MQLRDSYCSFYFPGWEKEYKIIKFKTQAYKEIKFITPL